MRGNLPVPVSMSGMWENGAMVGPIEAPPERKGAATDMFYLTPPRPHLRLYPRPGSLAVIPLPPTPRQTDVSRIEADLFQAGNYPVSGSSRRNEVENQGLDGPPLAAALVSIVPRPGRCGELS